MARRRYRNRRSYHSRRSSGGELLITFLVFIGIIFYQIYLNIKEAFIHFKQYVISLSPLDWLGYILTLSTVIFLYIYVSKWNKKRQLKVEQQQHEEHQLKIKEKVIIDGIKENLLTMHHTEFEHFIAKLFSLKGFEATVTPPSGDGGKDVILKKAGQLMVVECKRYNSPKVTRPDVQKFHSAVIDMKATEGYFVTTGQFTKPAIEYVTDKPIHLIDLLKLLDLIEEIKGDSTHGETGVNSEPQLT
jgi:HJR/Mrr/RecB family endonuclease